MIYGLQVPVHLHQQESQPTKMPLSTCVTLPPPPPPKAAHRERLTSSLSASRPVLPP